MNKPANQPRDAFFATEHIPAGFWLRLAGRLIDWIPLSGILVLVLGMGPSGLYLLGVPESITSLCVALFVLAHFAFFVAFTTCLGQTPGKWVVGIKVVDADGQPPRFGVTLRRELVEFLWMALRICLVGLLDPIWIAFTSKKQALHDLGAGTYVVRIARRPLIAIVVVAVIGVTAEPLSVEYVKRHSFECFYIPSGAMAPTLMTGDQIWVNKYIYDIREPEVAEVVVFEAPHEATPDRKDFIKRVVGLPGDILECRDGKLFRNDQPADEPYIRGPTPSYWPGLPQPYEVPQGSIVVFGDNRSNSNDSHRWGPLPVENLTGKALFIYWPPPRIGVL